MSQDELPLPRLSPGISRLSKEPCPFHGECWKPRPQRRAHSLLSGTAAPRPLSWRAGKCLHGHSRTKPCVPLHGLHCISPRSPPPKTSECGLIWNKVSEDVTKMRLYWVGPKSKNVPFHTEGRPRDTHRDKRTQRLEQRGHKTSAAGSHQGLGEAGKTLPPQSPVGLGSAHASIWDCWPPELRENTFVGFFWGGCF